MHSGKERSVLLLLVLLTFTPLLCWANIVEATSIGTTSSVASSAASSASASTTGGSSTSGDYCDSGQFYQNSYDNTHGTWSIAWQINCTSKIFSANITVQATGWVSFGINTKSKMQGADAIQAKCDPTTQSVTYIDAHITGTVAPTQDAHDDLSDVTCTQEAGKTIISFSRLLDTGDSQDLPFIYGDQYMLWAYNTKTDSFTTQHTSKGSTKINFFTGVAATGVDLKLLHGILMILAWALLSPIASFLAVFLKGIGHLWFQLHAAIQIIVGTIVIVAFIIIEVYLGPLRSAHFGNAHNDIGIIIVSLLFVQVFLGYLADKMYKADRKKVPIFPDQIHQWTGRLLFLLSITNVFLGFDQYGFTTTRVGTHIVFAVWMFLLFVLLGGLYWNRGRQDFGHAHVKEGFKVPFAVWGIIGAVGIIMFSVIAGLMFPPS